MRKNIANRPDIKPDALRQRRDLYALSIGLMLFNLAGGKIAANTAFGSLLPISIERPWLLLCAAWLGFFYFWFRFWLVSDVKPFGGFFEDVRWQTGNTRQVRTIAAKFVTRGPGNETVSESIRDQVRSSGGPIPSIAWEGIVPILGLNSVTSRADRGPGCTYVTLGSNRNVVSEEDRVAFWKGLWTGFSRAILTERAFTDYTLPHLVAVLTLGIGIVRFVAYESPTFHHAPPVTVTTEKSLIRNGVENKTDPALKVRSL